MIINIVTGWFEIKKYNDKREILTENFTETTQLSRYTWTTKIPYDFRQEFVGNKFENKLIEKEYGIKSKP